MRIEDVAKHAHELNRAYCLSIGDNSQPSWEEASQWQKDSAINGVIFHINNPEASPSASHENWLKEKLAAGCKFGEKKDPEAKTHPCCVPYEKLPAEQRSKDYIFKAIVAELAPYTRPQV